MAQSIITVPLYSIDEKDGLNKSLLQRSFSEAVKQMRQRLGMYVLYDRVLCYNSRGCVQKKLEEPVFYVFGNLYNIAQGRQFSVVPQSWLDQLEEQGFSHFVYNQRLGQIMAVYENKSIVLDDAVSEFLVRGKSQPFKRQKVWLLSEPVFKPLCPNSETYEYSVLAKILTDIKFNPAQFQGIETYLRVYYANGMSEITKSGTTYVFDDCIVGKGFLRKMFSGNKNVLRQINADKEDVMILDSDKRVYSLPRDYQLIKRSYIRQWLKS